jgi:DNA-binding MarR family transcriptional regulator
MPHDIESLAADWRALIGALRRRLREQADAGDLPPSQISALLRLERDGPMTISGLARAEGVRPQSMGAIIAALQSQNLVTGAPDPADGRQTIISLSAHFHRWISKGRAARQDWLVRQIAQLSPDEQAHLAAAAAILRRLSEN